MNRLEGIRALLERRQRGGTTHYEGCETEHIDCAAWRLLEVAEAAERAVSVGAVAPAFPHLGKLLDKLTVEIPE